jgi:hypothetical protein
MVGSRLSLMCLLDRMEIAMTGIYAVSKNSESPYGSSTRYILPRRSFAHPLTSSLPVPKQNTPWRNQN